VRINSGWNLVDESSLIKSNRSTCPNVIYNPETKTLTSENCKGSYLKTMGVFKNKEYHFTPDEGLYLLERGSIRMTLFTDRTPMSMQHAYHCLLSQPGDFERYHTYSYLKKLGYIVLPYQDTEGPRKSLLTSSTLRRNWPLIDVGLYTSVGRNL
jgi:hypothetical protein